MVTQDSTQTGLLNLIAELRAREKEQETALDETRRNIDAVQRALTLLRERYGLPGEEANRKLPLESLKGKTHLQALIAIAKSSNGRVKVIEAKRTLLEAGILTKPKIAYQQITSTLIRSDRFERAAPGEYRLVQHTFAS
jgi:hypothetical protein